MVSKCTDYFYKLDNVSIICIYGKIYYIIIPDVLYTCYTDVLWCKYRCILASWSQSDVYFLYVSTRWGGVKGTGVRLNKKTLCYPYRDFRYKDKTVSWPSYLYNGNPICRKTVFILKQGPDLPRWSNVSLQLNPPTVVLHNKGIQLTSFRDILHVDVLVQDCGISSALWVEISVLHKAIDFLFPPIV